MQAAPELGVEEADLPVLDAVGAALEREGQQLNLEPLVVAEAAEVQADEPLQLRCRESGGT